MAGPQNLGGKAYMDFFLNGLQKLL